MNMASMIAILENKLVDADTRYTAQERCVANSHVSTTLPDRWKQARLYLKKNKNEPRVVSQIAAATARAIAVLLAFDDDAFQRLDPQEFLWRSIYSCPGKETETFRNNFARLLLTRFCVSFLEELSFAHLESNDSTTDFEILEKIYFVFGYQEVRQLHEELLESHVPYPFG